MNLNLTLMTLAMIAILASGCGRGSAQPETYWPPTNAPTGSSNLVETMSAQDEFARSSFPTEALAVADGTNILHFFQEQSPQAEKELQSFVGRRVVLCGAGGGACPPAGDPADLVVARTILLKVNLTPQKDPRSQAFAWGVYVLGVLTKFDYRRKILWIDAHPDDWKLGVAM